MDCTSDQGAALANPPPSITMMSEEISGKAPSNRNGGSRLATGCSARGGLPGVGPESGQEPTGELPTGPPVDKYASVDESNAKGKVEAKEKVEKCTRPVVVALERIDAQKIKVAEKRRANSSAEIVDLSTGSEGEAKLPGLPEISLRRERGRPRGPNYKGPTKPLKTRKKDAQTSASASEGTNHSSEDAWSKEVERAKNATPQRKPGDKRTLEDRERKDTNLTARQKDAVEEVVQKFEGMSRREIAVTMLKVLAEAEDARRRSSNIKGDLNKKILVGLHSARFAVHRMATGASESTVEERESVVGDLRERCDRLEKEVRSLRKELEEARRLGRERARKEALTTPNAQEGTGAAVEEEVFLSVEERTLWGKTKTHPRRVEGEEKEGPSTAPSAEKSGWSAVRSRKTIGKGERKKSRGIEEGSTRSKGPLVEARSGVPGRVVDPELAKLRKRVPRSAAVMITCDGRGPSYAEVLGRASEAVSLETLGIVETRVRRGLTGGLIVEIPGKDMGEKADKLAQKLREVLEEEGVRVARPTRRAELRLSNLDDLGTIAEIERVISQVGGAKLEEVRVGNKRVQRNGLWSVIVQCPLECAVKIIKAPRVRIGWTVARVELLKKRPLQCFHCLAVGHVRDRCPSAADRSGLCCNCGEEGHKARDCRSRPQCPVCADRGLGTSHRAGSEACPPVPPGGLRNGHESAVRRAAQPEMEDIQKNLEEAHASLAVISEPYRVPVDDRWLGSVEEPPTVAISWQGAHGGMARIPLSRGPGYVVVRWGEVVVVGVYYSPRHGIGDFVRYLEELGEVLTRYSQEPVLLLGDLNAHSPRWDDRHSDAREEALVEWADSGGLVLLNEGTIPTCVHPRGTSVMDVSWANPAAARLVRSWRVDAEAVNLSDHRNILIELKTRMGRQNPGGNKAFPKWNAMRLDEDRLQAAAMARAWSASGGLERSAREAAEWVDITLREASDAAMPRARRTGGLPSVYWWNEEIEGLRTHCIRCRRRATRRRARADREAAAEAAKSLREVRKELRRAIMRSKTAAWEELLGTLDSDPWGRLYRIVMRRLRPAGPPVCETMSEEEIGRVVHALFPAHPVELRGMREEPREPRWDKEWSVSAAEVQEAVGRISRARKAAGAGWRTQCGRDRDGGVPPHSVGGVLHGLPKGGNLLKQLEEGAAGPFKKETILPPGCSVICYADDTAFVVTADSEGEVRVRAETAAARLVGTFERLGWSASLRKTQAMSFADVWHNPLRGDINVAGVGIPVKNSIKYLGLTIDQKWSFVDHFAEILPKAERAAMAVVRLMPNMRGPGERRRRLYAGVVHSMILYGAPVWAPAIAANRSLCRDIGRLQRRIALRVVAAYRTVSLEAACLLARIVLFDILARGYWRLYRQTRELREAGIGWAPGAERTRLAQRKRVHEEVIAE
ncbi:PREDICTED: uncharacterized protein LOC105450628 [Wasmannia auropunctata]|uniref:uncharacterized protein LOC105450628 n=1 Tax=Wasmannia auropunctata TaxID=64793 RepID=UPI0005EDAC05|nr:PREDICTED: uncharacterized protein LOC105450628 [Wasmannia auropunctata]